jgi:hypothetical protein
MIASNHFGAFAKEGWDCASPEDVMIPLAM